jgi:hypothetical protein
LPRLREAPGVKGLFERPRELFRLQTEVLADLLGAKPRRVLLEERYDLLDDARDIARGSPG